jgi:hypothetical protein
MHEEIIAMALFWGTIITIVSVYLLYHGIIGLSNPEYYAIEKFLGHLPR